MRKAKTRTKPASEIVWTGNIVIRATDQLREKLRVAAFKHKLPPSVYARYLIEEGLKQKRAE